VSLRGQPGILQALEASGAAAVLLRPDGYVFASANAAADIAGLSHNFLRCYTSKRQGRMEKRA